ncbi:MAG: hypothetical protein PWR27_515 [Petroclostridium sp.]|uniref:DUF5685 family protein n=1 Tax=Petroclostridium xylanilyticum TaxID=1792311 RepID=UPI000B98288E|nr:DUF5685 family protein [Petroclostridium xylanilyticum]MBZ4645161.1 hypothetical protein [Clostridia bacterium]MDK2809806.1 hypothetical protein [Petroclostridium sp.]
MFGYVIPYKDELKIREYNFFRAYYCGLCKALGKEFNQAVRMGLNYDFAFLALLLSSIHENKQEFTIEGCFANPVKKKPIMLANQHIQYSAYMSIILVYFKLLDDWQDDKSFPALFVLPAYLRPVKKAKEVYRRKYENIKQYLKQLSELERSKCEIIDESADAFAKLMQEIFIPPYVEDEKTKRILGWMGYNLGRWIYILDAFHDIEKDAKQNRYNPVLLQYKYDEKEDMEAFRERIKGSLEISLTFTLDNIAKSFELLDIKHNKTILDNIIYMGLRDRMRQIFEKRGCSKYEKSL